MLKVVHINYSDQRVGEGVAIWQLMERLAAAGHSSRLFASQKTTGDARVVPMPMPSVPWQKELLEKQRRQGVFDVYPAALMGVLQHPAFEEADVVHLHSTAGGYFSYLLLPYLAAKPLVWTLYDQLPYTGGCQNAEHCQRWRQEECSNCPLDAQRSQKTQRDLVQRLRRNIYQITDFTVVCRNQWTVDRVNEGILAGHPVKLIGGGVDTNIFRPNDRTGLRAMLGLPQDKILIAVTDCGGAANPVGVRLLCQALQVIGARQDVVLLNLGGAGQAELNSVRFPRMDLPLSGDTKTIADYCVAADVYIAPLLVETPGMGLMEASACGTPVVAFGAGGISELVVHGQTGYLARIGDANDFATGIRYFLDDETKRLSAGQAAREKAVAQFTALRMGDEYLNLYASIARKNEINPVASKPVNLQTQASVSPPQQPTLAEVAAELRRQYKVVELFDQAKSQGWQHIWEEFQRQYNEFGDAKAGDRALFTDLFFAHCLESIDEVTDSQAFWGIVEKWHYVRKMPPRCGGLPQIQQQILLYYCLILRKKLHRYFTETPLEQTVRLSEREQLTVIALWRQVFLNAFSPINMELEVSRNAEKQGETIMAGNSDNAWYPKIILASMYAPFSADVLPIDAGKVWSAPNVPIWCKAVIAFWLVSTPYFNSEERHRQKILKYVAAFCQSAIENPQYMSPGFFRAFLEEAMSGLWRAAYVGGNNVKELSAFGDFIKFYMTRFHPKFKKVKFDRKRRAGDKIRVGYISRNFCSQAVSYYMVNRVLHHSPEQFDVHIFAIGDRDDAITELFKKHSRRFTRFEKLFDVDSMAKAIVDSKLDLLIYTDIGMDPVTYMLAGFQLAPVQAALVGHGTTTGLSTIQYYISGDFEPQDAQEHYREKLICLPNLGAAQYPPSMEPHTLSRQALKIPEEAVVFVSCANGIKHGPARDRILVEILKQAPNSWIILKPFQNPQSVNPLFAHRVMTAARNAGVGERLVILPPLPQAKDVMGLLAIADIQLDTFPYGGWTTNMEAFHMGLPVVTQQGGMMRNRWGAFMLRAMGIREGLAGDEAEYIAWAVRMARDSEMRSRLRATIKEKAAAVLFNGEAAQKPYEDALLSMINRR